MNDMRKIPVKEIDLNDYNPSERASDLQPLVESIARDGQLQSILVRPVGARFEVVCGTRRLLALRILGKTEALCTVESMGRETAMRRAFSENNDRMNLSAVDEAIYFCQLLGVTQYQLFGRPTPGHPQVSKGLPTHKNRGVQKLARQLGISAKRIEDRLPLAALPPQLRTLVRTGEMKIQQAEILARLRLLPIPDDQVELGGMKKCLLIGYPILELHSEEALDIIARHCVEAVKDGRLGISEQLLRFAEVSSMKVC